MATVYVRSTDGNDADDGSTWALADALLATSLTAAGAGGRSYVSQAHAETTAAAITLVSPGTAASPTQAICGNDAAEPPTAVATSATVSTTGTNSNITFSGFAEAYGILFQTGGTNVDARLHFNSGSPWCWVLDTCTLKLNTTNASSLIQVGTTAGAGDDQYLKLINCTITFGAVGQKINLSSARLEMLGGSVTGTAPTTFLIPSGGASQGISATFIGVDLSNLGSGKNLVSVAGAAPGLVTFLDCKLGASVSPVTGTRPGPGGIDVLLVNCDSGDTHYRYFSDTYTGQITHETTIIRTGGASDGTQGFSRKFVTSAGARFYGPLIGPWSYFWLDTPGAVTAAMEIVNDGTTYTDADVAVEVEALTNSGFPFGSFANDRSADILAAPADQTTSSETWTTTGLASPVKQVCSKAVTTAESGWVRARLLVYKPSTTLYACPKILSTSQYQYMTENGSIVNGPAAASGAAGPSFGQHSNGPSFVGRLAV